MASARVTDIGPCTLHFWPRVIFERRRWFVLVGAVVLASLACAQGNPRVTGVEPASGKTNDNVTVSGRESGEEQRLCCVPVRRHDRLQGHGRGAS